MVQLSDKDTIYIHISSPEGWILEVFPGGSGKMSLQWYSDFSVSFTEGSFQFEKLKQRLLRQSSHQKPLSHQMGLINFGLVHPKLQKTRYVKDMPLIDTLFKQAKQAVLSTNDKIYLKRKLRKLYRQYPPVSKQ